MKNAKRIVNGAIIFLLAYIFVLLLLYKYKRDSLSIFFPLDIIVPAGVLLCTLFIRKDLINSLASDNNEKNEKCEKKAPKKQLSSTNSKPEVANNNNNNNNSTTIKNEKPKGPVQPAYSPIVQKEKTSSKVKKLRKERALAAEQRAYQAQDYDYIARNWLNKNMEYLYKLLFQELHGTPHRKNVELTIPSDRLPHGKEVWQSIGNILTKQRHIYEYTVSDNSLKLTLTTNEPQKK